MSNDLIIIEPIDPNDITIPDAAQTINKVKALARRNAIKNHSLVIHNRELGANSIEVVQPRENIKAVLGLDSDKEARLFLSNLNDDDVYDDNVLLPALHEHAYIRVEEAETPEAEEEALDIIQCLDAAVQCPSVKEKRTMIKEQMDSKWPRFRNEQLKKHSDGVCVVSHKTLGDKIDLHHLTPRSDKPEDTLNPNNVGPANSQDHQQYHSEEKKHSSKKMRREKKAIEGLDLGATVKPKS
ncbi:hypothetical protein AB4455_26295 [Vibrio sp. 10N.261.46.E12]|uniref:hypothetical protein n=1 Tax=unclassified Vibrio TaxID=2614977 RepID=UPI000977633A|nr:MULTISPECIES: hypothetical protein [unclassified Vibrio]OMO38296.1 hypothetical protein BH584_18325 [Vibrio sp. 10N.261.45.E1]PMJ36110.1 hypothetical protein BCU27_23700 [Vibrio sp. 10N.286.45.B6]PML93025.1 hypothetical protein BCT66_24985 [Vibrio sp. 10N.261.49.E11]PMM66845.1 hypothetical protein BCT48_16565 [Vibrio sp. 10N.261.46.F12]PMM88067.1 hypothetical protein BCT46_25870 [Vibrio sp. 10N.261.46.E8]